jgi:hypothetical protein
VLTKKDASELLSVVLDARPSEEKLAASAGRIMRFRERFPGFFQKVGSSPGRQPELRQTALAIDGAVIAGYVDGDVLRIEPDTGRIDSVHRGTIAPARATSVIEVPSESVFTTVDGEVWILAPDRIRVVDLDRRIVRDGPRLEGWTGIESIYGWNVTITDDLIVSIGDEAKTFRRSDGVLVAKHAMPKTRGAIYFDGAVAFLPKERVSFEGFTVERLDLFTGARTEYASHRFDEPRSGGDPTESASLTRVGKHAVLRSWGMRVFDPVTGTMGPQLPKAVIEARSRYGIEIGGRTAAMAEGGRMIAVDLDRPDFSVLAEFELDGDLDRAKPATFSRESGRSAAATPRSRIVVWERDGSRVTEILGHRDPTEMWISPNGKTLAVFDWRATSILRLWSLD